MPTANDPSFSDLDLVASGGGTSMRLRVKPGARADSIEGVHGGALKIRVTAPPERGKANRAVLELLADRLGVPLAAVELIAGASSPDKTVLIALPPDRVRDRLRAR